MFPEFANVAGFWALLAVPVVLAIHFFQQRRRQAVISTLFLLEALAPESRGGRTWERLRSSRTLWLQLLAVILIAWVIVEPRWVRAGSTQTVAVVLDSSASLAAFRPAAERAVATLLAEREGRAARTEWLLMTSDPRQPPLYRGPSRAAAGVALANWHPALGTHDVRPALRLAQALAGANGLTWFVTDSRAQVPVAQPAVGVGHPLANVGFAGADVQSSADGPTWRALVQNHTDQPQRRSWWVEANGAGTPAQTMEFKPGALLELSGRLPAGVDRATVVLEPDEFPADDRLPLMRPVAKPLAVSLELDGAPAEFFRRLAGTIDGVVLSRAGLARLRVLRLAPDSPRPATAAIILQRESSDTDRARMLRLPVVVEKHPLTADLNWQGWLGSGPQDFSRAPGDHVLLWQNGQALAWLTAEAAETRALLLNFDWEVSNAGRLPAAVLLLRRQITSVRDAQPGAYAANFDALEPVPLARRDLAEPGDATLEFQAAGATALAGARTVAPAELAVLRAPDQPGFFVLRRGERVLVRGAAHFSDPRQADFRRAETFATAPPPEADALFQRNTSPDPLALLWLALAGLCLLASWLPPRAAAGFTPPGARAEVRP